MASLIRFKVNGIERQMVSGCNPNQISKVFLVERIMDDFSCNEGNVEIVSIEEAKTI